MLRVSTAKDFVRNGGNRKHFHVFWSTGPNCSQRLDFPRVQYLRKFGFLPWVFSRDGVKCRQILFKAIELLFRRKIIACAVEIILVNA